MKKNLLFVLCLTCLGGATSASASSYSTFEDSPMQENITPKQDFTKKITIADLNYSLDEVNMTAEVSKGESFDMEQDALTIPETIEYEGKTYTVTSLANGAFAYCDFLRFVTLPETIENISQRAFRKCLALESINIPSKVKNIGNSAFYDCECLLNIDFPEGLETIGEEVFYTCPSLRSVHFAGDKVTVIPKAAFAYCMALSDINIPKNLKVVGDQAFYSCQCITTFDLPETVEYIGEYAFGTCIGLTHVEIPNKVTEIKTGTYINCSGIKAATIPENIQKIFNKAFAFCENLDELKICKNVEFIGANAFQGCSMSFLTFEDGDKPCTLDVNNLNDGRLAPFDGVEISELYIGREVKNLVNWSSEFLKKLTIGANVTVWHNDYCGNHAQTVESMILNPTQLLPSFDEKIYEKTVLRVPSGTAELYKNAPGWMNFKNIEEDSSLGIEGVNTETDKVIGYYTVDGIRSNKPVKGLNIIKLNDGKTKKIFIK